MTPYCLLPGTDTLECSQVKIGPQLITIHVASTLPTGKCPACGQPSRRVHSRYVRTLADLPWQGRRVQVRWRSRRFFCDNFGCSKGTFAEQLPDVAAPYARRTTRLAEGWRNVAFTAGGEAGARLAGKLGMPTSADTLLRLMRRTPPHGVATPHVLGVDDWALCRGTRYGTILCDLQRHCSVDLLPERSSNAFSTWLAEHPGVEIISRDRGDDYKKGATEGAPQAKQVADRWHLLHNLHEVLVRVADRHHEQIAKAAKVTAEKGAPGPKEQADASLTTSSMQVKLTCAQQRKQMNRERRLKRYERVLELHQQGKPHRAIARELKMHRGTVRRFIRAGRFPERATRKFHSKADSYVDQLRQRWDEGCRNVRQLTLEQQAQGANVSYHMVRRRVAPWRDAKDVDHTPGAKPKLTPPAIKRPSSRRVAWILMKERDELEPEEQALRDALMACCPQLQSAMTLAHEFTQMIHERRSDDLDTWIDLASDHDAPVDLRRFARGLTNDLDAVHAALTLAWSNGQVEGQINRLKLIKRQMYGRAKFDLLRSRFLHTG